MMKYIVMECHPSYAVLLDEEGRFVKAANLHYETGQTVCEPVLMREEPVKQRNRLRWARSGFAAVAACFLLLIGLNYYRSTLTAYSSIYLTINPEVQMDLNRKGAVIRLEGINEDGAALLEDYEYKGKDRLTVADDLIERAIDMGFLSEGGQVSFSIDAPDEALVQKYGEELQTEVLKHLENRYTITVEVVNHQTGETESSQKTQGAQETQSTQETQETPVSQDVPESITVPVAPEGGSDYVDTDYGPDSDGVTDYSDTDYGPDSDGATDYSDTDYGPDSDGDTAYTPPAEPAAPPAQNENASNYDDGGSSYSSSNYDDSSSDYDDGSSSYSSSDYDDSSSDYGSDYEND